MSLRVPPVSNNTPAASAKVETYRLSGYLAGIDLTIPPVDPDDSSVTSIEEMSEILHREVLTSPSINITPLLPTDEERRERYKALFFESHPQVKFVKPSKEFLALLAEFDETK